MTKLVLKSALGDISAASITTVFNMNARHSLFLSYVLGSIATTESSYVILGVDFVLNVVTALRIFWLRKIRRKYKEAIKLLQELVIIELVEVVVPLTYLACFLVSYYGPNSQLIGNMQNSYWQYTAIEDVDQLIKNVTRFFLIDLLSGIAASVILWFSCRIDLLKVYAVLQKEFGIYFLTTLGYILLVVRNKSL
jgi:hypothetical protein